MQATVGQLALLALLVGARAATRGGLQQMLPGLCHGAADSLMEVAAEPATIPASSFRNYRWTEARPPFNKHEEAARWAVTTMNHFPDMLSRIYGSIFDRRHKARFYCLERAYYYEPQEDDDWYYYNGDYYYYLRVRHIYRGRLYTYDYVVYWPEDVSQSQTPYYAIHRIVCGRSVWDGKWYL